MKYLIAPLLLLCAPLSAMACSDSEYACSVALCVANPSGPTAVSECKPCIDRLRKALKKGKGWPSCDGVTQGKQMYEKCATLYESHPVDLAGGAWCGKPGATGASFFAAGAKGAASLLKGKPMAKPYYEDIKNADGTVTRYWFSLAD